jgi:hypothetical protein
MWVQYASTVNGPEADLALRRLKITRDVLLLAQFRRVKPPGER